MGSTIKKNTKKTSRAIISEEMMCKEIMDCKNEEKIGTDSKMRCEIEIEEEKEIFEFAQHLFYEGTHISCYEFMGAHFVKYEGKNGVRFTTWDPRASKITVIGDFSQ